MSQEKLKLGSAINATEISRFNERILVYTYKTEIHQKRKAFSQENITFELYRRRLYRNLEDDKPVEHQVGITEIKSFWETMWNKRQNDSNGTDLDTYLIEHLSREEPLNVFPTFEEFQEVVKWLPN